MEVDEIQAGPETDLAVAEAVGMNCKIGVDCETGLDSAFVGRDAAGRYFRPSTDWNDAMEAAAMVLDGSYSRRQEFSEALLDTVVPKRSATWEGPWSFWELLFGMFVKVGPLAICRAVLKAEGDQQ